MQSDKEVQIFTQYLLNIQADKSTAFLYQKGLETKQFSLTDYEHFLLTIIYTFPFLCGVIDHISAIFKCNNGIRKRLFLVLSILETHPKYSGSFLHTPSLSAAIFMLCIGVVKTFSYTLIGLFICPIFYIHYHGYFIIRLYYSRIRL